MVKLQKKNIVNGLVSGLLTGLLFGIVLAKMGQLPRIGAFIGLSNATMGFAFFLLVSALLGALFGFLCQKLVYNPVHGIVFGALYGVILWILGPLTLIPMIRNRWNDSTLDHIGTNVGNFFSDTKAAMGSTDQIWSAASLNVALHCLLYYVVFGVLVGVIYALLRKLFSASR